MTKITMFLLNFFLLPSFFVSPYAWATKVAVDQSPKTLFDEVRQKYSKYKLVSMDASRETYSKLLEKTKKTDLKIFLSSAGDLRLETTVDPRSITILSNKQALVIDEPDPVFGGPLRVLVSENPDLKKSQSFLRLIFGADTLGDLYKIAGGDQKSIQLKAIKKNLSVQTAEVEFDKDNKTITKIVYWDERDNKITLLLTNLKFSKKEDKSLFEFKIPKDAEVTKV